MQPARTKLEQQLLKNCKNVAHLRRKKCGLLQRSKVEFWKNRLIMLLEAEKLHQLCTKVMNDDYEIRPSA